MLNLIPILIASFWIASTSWAHSGHTGAGQESGFVHYLSDPVHLPWVLVVMCGVLAGTYALNRRRATSPSRSKR
jgi:hydrogenase/urease accessory protein HupE